MTESSVRHKAIRRGYKVHKSRERKYVPHLDNHGEYMLVDAYRNLIVLGVRYDASLEDIEKYLEGVAS